MRRFMETVQTLNEAARMLFFLRNTTDPERDLGRGFSCHVDGWRKTPEHNPSALRKPLQDPDTKLWCVDPELGLSSFACWDEPSFARAMKEIEIYAVEPEIAVFRSMDYDLHAGADGEDVFRDGEFVGFIEWGSSWTDLLTVVEDSA